MASSNIYDDCLALLQQLIKAESLSGHEDQTAGLIEQFFASRQITTTRLHNNIIARGKYWDDAKPIVALNSHHDTVMLGDGWTKDPLGAEIAGDYLYGRGSNDAGGALVSLIGAFSTLFGEELPYNLMLIASGEEENFGPNGVSAVLSDMKRLPDLAIIGEPTEMQIGIAEKGLIVIDAEVLGKSGHAARDVGVNALYLATDDIVKIRSYEWEKISDVLGVTKTTITQISSGSQHNVIPEKATYVIDCRVNERYTLQEVLSTLDELTHAQLSPRSLRWHPSGISKDHAVVHSAKSLGRKVFGSPTLSDQVHFKCPTIKMGPGKSERSHTPDEFILLSELKEGLDIYLALLRNLKL